MARVMPSRFADTRASSRERAPIAVAVALLHALVALALIHARIMPQGQDDRPLRRVMTAVVLSPPPTAPQPRAKLAAGAPAPKAVAAPAPAVPLPLTTAPVAVETGSGAQSGAGVTGTGSGAAGTGTGPGGAGTGQGGGARAEKIAGDLTERDYPKAGRAKRLGTAVIVALTVGTDGRVTACTVHQPSGDPEADAITCRLASERFRFHPARNAAGEAIEATYGWQQRFFAP
jgi:protein TonB